MCCKVCGGEGGRPCATGGLGEKGRELCVCVWGGGPPSQEGLGAVNGAQGGC